MPQTHHATGTFEVKLLPMSSAAADGISRMSMEKQTHGGLEAISKGEMMSAGNYKAGQAGYVAMETVTGTLEGKTGSFVLQHSATMNASGQELKVIVTPGSGTGQLQGISGVFTIVISQGQHSYTFDYTLPPDK